MTKETTGKYWRRRREGSRSGGAGKTVSWAGEVTVPKLKDGQIRCPCCRQACTPTAKGRPRAHKDLFGHPCDFKSEVPTEIQVPAVSTHTNSIPPNGYCQECGTQVMIGRRLCGRCYARRA